MLSFSLGNQNKRLSIWGCLQTEDSNTAGPINSVIVNQPRLASSSQSSPSVAKSSCKCGSSKGGGPLGEVLGWCLTKRPVTTKRSSQERYHSCKTSYCTGLWSFPMGVRKAAPPAVKVYSFKVDHHLEMKDFNAINYVAFNTVFKMKTLLLCPERRSGDCCVSICQHLFWKSPS